MIQNYSLLSHNTFGIDVRARYFAEYASVDELKACLTDYFRQQHFDPSVGGRTELLHIGAGSNLLFLTDYKGLVLHSRIQGIHVIRESAEHVVIRVGAGMVWDELVAETIRRGWFGLENLSLIPGEVGASAVQNIGAYGREAKDFITRVHLLNMYTLKEVTLENADLEYAYRYSKLKTPEYRGIYAVTSVEYALYKIFVPHLEYGGLRSAVEKVGCPELTAQALRDIIIQTRQGKLPDPKVLGNAGSFFMNPVVERPCYESLQRQYPLMPHYEVDARHVKIPAGWLIEQTGWKGRKLGAAGVYEKQALVLVNHGGATGQDIVNLCETVRQAVKEKFGIDIRPEVNFIGA